MLLIHVSLHDIGKVFCEGEKVPLLPWRQPIDSFFWLITVREAAFFMGIHVVSINILSFNNINLLPFSVDQELSANPSLLWESPCNNTGDLGLFQTLLHSCAYPGKRVESELVWHSKNC